MAATAASIYLAHQLTLFPAPLHVRKKSKRYSRLRLGQRKPTRSQASQLQSHGPLDDIIDEITGFLWRSPPNDTLDWPTSFKSPFDWKVIPLPVSRIPSSQPLAVRKTRHTNSRSTASGSTISDEMDSSRGSSESAPTCPSPPSLFPSLLDSTIASSAYEDPSNKSLNSSDSGSHGREEAGSSRPSRLRRITNTMGKLRLKSSDSGKQDASTIPTSPFIVSPTSLPSTSLGMAPGENRAPTTEAVAEWVAQNGRKPDMIGEVFSRAESPRGFVSELPRMSDVTSEPVASESILAAAVRIIPELRVLTEDEQVFWIAVEVEGVLHNRRGLPNNGIDTVFLIDNAYHVTSECLTRAVEIASSLLSELKGNDRVALYTTHCTHEAVTGTVPDLWYPLGAADKAATDIIREMLTDIKKLGTQAWQWPRPNPSLGEVLVTITKSLESRCLDHSRTQILVLSPVARDVHEISKLYPLLHVNQINPATLPFHGDRNPEEMTCMEQCCTNVSVNNVEYYQPAENRARQILRHARSEKPVGTIRDAHVDLRRCPGCEVLRYEGSSDIPKLRLGQVHTFFAQMKVVRSHTKEMDLDSVDPVRDSILAANNLGQDLRNAKFLGATKVHLLSAQVMHRTSLSPSNQWVFTETPMFVFKELGRMTTPTDRALEVYKRRFFYILSRIDLNSVVADIVNDLDSMVKPQMKEHTKKILDNMAKEVVSHKAIVEYEKAQRQGLPSCTGPVAMPYHHGFLVDKWETRKKKRMGHFVA